MSSLPFHKSQNTLPRYKSNSLTLQTRSFLRTVPSPQSSEIDELTTQILSGEFTNLNSLPTSQAAKVIRNLHFKKTKIQDETEIQKINRIISALSATIRQNITSNTRGYEICKEQSNLGKNKTILQAIRRQKNYLVNEIEVEMNNALIKELSLINQERSTFISMYGPELPFEIHKLIIQVNSLREQELRSRAAHNYKEADSINAQILQLENVNIKMLSRKYNSSVLKQYHQIATKHQHIHRQIVTSYQNKLNEQSQDLNVQESETVNKIETLRSSLGSKIGEEKLAMLENSSGEMTTRKSSPCTTRYSARLSPIISCPSSPTFSQSAEIFL